MRNWLSCWVLAAIILGSSSRGLADEPQSRGSDLIVQGRTQCVLHRRAIIAPAVLHPVEEVLVSPGDKVKKGQVLVKIDSDEPQADLRGKQAALESARLAHGEAKRVLAKLELSFNQGAIPEQRYHDAKVAVQKSEIDERIAKAAVDVATAELEHYNVTAPIDGVVNRLDVHPGAVSRPGTSVWGEILDLTEIDVACQLTVDQIELLGLGQTASVRNADGGRFYGKGRIVYMGLAADEQTGKLPAIVRLANERGQLRCGVAVQVRFTPSEKVTEK